MSKMNPHKRLAAGILLSLLCRPVPAAVVTPAYAQPAPVLPVPELSTGLSKPVRLILDGVPVSDALYMACGLARLALDLDPTVFGEPEREAVVTLHLAGLESRYFIAWMLHLAQADGTVTIDGRSIHVVRAQEQQAADTPFACWRETDGPWRAGLLASLAGEVDIDLTDAPVRDAIRVLMRISGLQIIVDPGLLQGRLLDTPVSIAVQAQTSEQALAYTLNQVGLMHRLQGGVIFITNH